MTLATEEEKEEKEEKEEEEEERVEEGRRRGCDRVGFFLDIDLSLALPAAHPDVTLT